MWTNGLPSSSAPRRHHRRHQLLVYQYVCVIGCDARRRCSAGLSTSRRHKCSFGALAVALGQTLMPFAGSLPMLVAAMALMPIGTAMLFPATTAQVSRHAPAGHVGEFMGLQQALGGTARVLGPVCAGAVFQHLGVPWPFWLAAILMTRWARGGGAGGARGSPPRLV